MPNQGDRRLLVLILPTFIMAIGFFVLFLTGQSIVGWAAVLVAAAASLVIVTRYLVSQPQKDRKPHGR